MPSLQVRELPDEIYERLKAVAEAEHRSLAQQTVVALEHFLDTHEIVNGKVVAKGGETAGPAAQAKTPFVPFERDGITYMTDPNETKEERKARIDALFDEIASRPPVPLPEGYESIADLIRREREERTDRILNASNSIVWEAL